MQTIRLRIIANGAVALFIVSSFVLTVQSSTQDQRSECCGTSIVGRLARYCETREQTLVAPSGRLSVDSGENGGIRIEGWDRKEMLVRACVQVSSTTVAKARELAGEIKIRSDNALIHAEGPPPDANHHWSVSYEIFVPRRSDIFARSRNGGVRLSDLLGRIEFETMNGGVSLVRLGGLVRGKTTNGGLSIDLSDTRWEGEGLDVQSTNGSITMLVPENYSARFEVGTVHSNLNIDFPVTLEGRLNDRVSLTLGSGGVALRAITENAGVTIKRKRAD